MPVHSHFISCFIFISCYFETNNYSIPRRYRTRRKRLVTALHFNNSWTTKQTGKDSVCACVGRIALQFGANDQTKVWVGEVIWKRENIMLIFVVLCRGLSLSVYWCTCQFVLLIELPCCILSNVCGSFEKYISVKKQKQDAGTQAIGRLDFITIPKYEIELYLLLMSGAWEP